MAIEFMAQIAYIIGMELRENHHSLLSVVVPVTRMSGRLERMSKWLRKVYLYPVEVIIVHDHRDKETLIELQSMVESFGNPKIILIDGELGSPGISRNAGLKICSGSWVAFWDSDDSPDLESAIQILGETWIREFDCIAFTFVAVNEVDGTTKICGFGKDPIADLALTPGIWRFLFRKSTLTGHQFTNLGIGEDQLFLATYDLEGKKVSFRDNPIYSYYFGADGHQSNSKKAQKDIVRLLKFTRNLLNAEHSSRRFLELQFARQSFTGMKMLNWHIAIQVFGEVVILMNQSSPKNRIDIVRAFGKILSMDRRIL